MRQSQLFTGSISALLRWSTIVTLLWCATAPMSALQAQMVPTTGAAETAIHIPEELTQAQVSDLVARLSDAEVRELIITQLDKQASTPDEAVKAAASVLDQETEADKSKPPPM